MGTSIPAVTAAFIVIRRIDPIDGLVYILAQLSGGVLGALLTKAFLLDEGRASDYGTPKISALLGGAFQGFLVEGIGAFVLVLVVLSVALNPETRRWAALAIGGALGFLVMVLGPLTGGSFNPARWFGPALVSNHFTDAWAYILGPLVGGLLAAAVYKFIIEPSSGPVQEMADTIAPRGPAPPAGESPPLRQGPGGPPPSSPPGGIAGSLASIRRHRPTSLGLPCDAQGDLLAELHALALEDVSVLLQVLRLCDASGAHPRSG